MPASSATATIDPEVRCPRLPGMDIVRGAKRRCEVRPAQCHARHTRWGAKSAFCRGIADFASIGRAVSNRFWIEARCREQLAWGQTSFEGAITGSAMGESHRGRVAGAERPNSVAPGHGHGHGYGYGYGSGSGRGV